jgi:transcriptional regulator PpsR
MDARTSIVDPPSFKAPNLSLRNLSIEDATQLLAVAGDVALVIDGDGVVRDLAIGNAELERAGLDEWRGRAWLDTVTVESRPKVLELLRDAGSAEARRWRQVNHVLPDGEIPIRYFTVRTDGGDDTIAIGRDLRANAALQQRLLKAQQAMERDQLRLRQAESRYRLLFERSMEAVMIVDAATRRIVEANPAAEALSGKAKLNGQLLQSIVEPASRDTTVALLGAVAASDNARPVQVTMAGSGIHCTLTATLFRQSGIAHFFARLAPVSPDDALVGSLSLDETLSRVPDPFVIADEAMAIVAHNDPFLDLVGAARSDAVIGKPLEDFIGRPGIDMTVIAAELRQHHAIRNFETVARDGSGGPQDIELSGVAAPQGERLCYGFTLRTVSRQREPVRARLDAPRSVEQLTSLIGRMPLKDIVRESTDLIERLCIEAALEHTANNRASAAEILGLSRQGLYSKLRRYGFAVGSDDEDDVKPD